MSEVKRWSACLLSSSALISDSCELPAKGGADPDRLRRPACCRRGHPGGRPGHRDFNIGDFPGETLSPLGLEAATPATPTHPLLADGRDLPEPRGRQPTHVPGHRRRVRGPGPGAACSPHRWPNAPPDTPASDSRPPPHPAHTQFTRSPGNHRLTRLITNAPLPEPTSRAPGTQPLLNHARQQRAENRQPRPRSQHPDQPGQGPQPRRPTQGTVTANRSRNARPRPMDRV